MLVARSMEIRYLISTQLAIDRQTSYSIRMPTLSIDRAQGGKVSQISLIIQLSSIDRIGDALFPVGAVLS